MEFSLFTLTIFVLFVYLLLYTIIDRICKCVERCNTSKAFEKFIENKNIEDIFTEGEL